jgi:hypothetical protein
MPGAAGIQTPPPKKQKSSGWEDLLGEFDDCADKHKKICPKELPLKRKEPEL